MDSKNFAIGVLSTTSAILLVGVVVVITRPQPVIAAGMSASGGEYIMSVGTSAQVDEEFLYVVDVPARKMLVYRFDGNRSVIEIVQGIDLGELRPDAGNQPGRQNQPPGRSGQP